jgi:DNA-binding transcriptional regulator YiaG
MKTMSELLIDACIKQDTDFASRAWNKNTEISQSTRDKYLAAEQRERENLYKKFGVHEIEASKDGIKYIQQVCTDGSVFWETIKIKALREVVGLSQQQLADKSGVSIRTLQKYECGDNNPANAQAWIIIALAEALGVEPKELI